jgi:purine-cytosine permease-like protein
MWVLENPVAATILVGVLAALGFLGLKAVLGGIETADLVTAPLVGIGSAVGYRLGVQRSERKRRGK